MRKKSVLIPLLITLSFYILLCARLFFSVSLHDEVFNIAEAYRIVQGDIPFVDVWDFYHMGSMINVPFIYLFVSITGSTDGIVLFLRLVYLVLVSLESILVFFILLRIFRSKEVGLFTSLILITYAPFSLYYFWYDTSMMHFSVLSIMFFSCAYVSQGRIRKILFILAGFLHACVVYSYPTMLIYTIAFIILIVFLIKNISYNINLKDFIFFISGGLLVLVIFLVCALITGKYVDFFFLDSSYFSFALRGRSVSLDERVAQLVLLLKMLIKQMLWAIIPTIILLGVFVHIYRKQTKKWMGFFLTGICLTSLLFAIQPEQTSSIVYSFWLALWSPFLLYLFPANDRKRCTPFFLLCSIASVSGVIAMVAISLGSGVKIFLATLPNTIFSVALVIILSKRYILSVMRYFLTSCIPLTYLLLFWLTTFAYYPVVNCTNLVDSGIWKGIYVAQPTVDFYLPLEKTLDAIIQEDDQFILVIGEHTYICPIYLMTNLRPSTGDLQWTCLIEENSTYDWNLLNKYIDEKERTPDILVIQESSIPIVEANFDIADYKFVDSINQWNIYSK